LAVKTLAIVGRPNVGKSTLFNRLTGERAALVDDQPGVTRDWREGEADLFGLTFKVLDTAGIDRVRDDSLSAQVQAQTRSALQRADMFLFVLDAREGVTGADREVAQTLRRAGKPVVLVANKVEGQSGLSGVAEADALGFGDAVAFSAEHAIGLDDLYRALAPYLESDEETGAGDQDAPPPDGDEASPRARPLMVAVIGRPNVGKSTLMNRLLGEERVVTSPIAGTTRDAIAVDWEWGGRKFRLVDTAGLRRKAKVDEKLEKLSVGDALKTIRFAEMVILVVDVTQPFETQDLQIADLVEREGRAMVVAVNKWDLVEDKAQALRALKERLETLLPQWRGVPLVALSAMGGEGVDRLMPAVLAQDAIWNKRVATAQLNRWLEEALERHAPPAAKGRRLKIRYMTQAKARPPTFAVFASQAGELPDDYVRYLVNGLREAFGFHGVPVRLNVKAGKNPYADKRSG
jgi:GTP-binding protein